MHAILAIFLFMGCGYNWCTDREPLGHNPGDAYRDSCKATLLACENCDGQAYKESQTAADHADIVVQITDGETVLGSL